MLRMRVSLSCPVSDGLLFRNGWRIGKDQIPREPLIVRILRFLRIGRSLCNTDVSGPVGKKRTGECTWKRVKPPKVPAPVAATSSGTAFS